MNVRRQTAAVTFGLALLASGCVTLGPDYERPKLGAPESYRGAAAEPVSGAASIAEAEWSELFVDPPLQELIRTALSGAFDARIAAARLLEAEALAGITDSDRFPSLDAAALAQRESSTAGSADGSRTTTERYQVSLGFHWEIDFWGRYRRASESARAQMLAAEWGQRAVATTLVSRVATGYFTLLALDRELEIATRTQGSREESLRLTTVRESGGAASLVDVRQAEQLVLGAQAVEIELEGRIEQQENFLSVLVGGNPEAIARGAALGEQARVAALPEGLPSDLLERRPDIREAEERLAAATADIGVARSDYFPRIALTGAGGSASSALSALFHGPAAIWSAAASAVAPIFNAGRTSSGVKLAEARRAEAAAIYEQTVRVAFREVSDALVDRRRTIALVDIERRLVAAAEDARRLADVRYRGGAASYLEVLDSDSRLFEAELTLARTELDALAADVEIYRALGGGWTE